MDFLPELNEAFLRVARQLRRETQRRIAPLGLNPHQSRALRMIHQNEPVRPSELALRLGVAARSVTDSTIALIEAGLLRRQPDPRDKRAHLLALTPSGHAAVDQVLRVRDEVAAIHFGCLDPARQQQLAALLSELETSFSNLNPCAEPSRLAPGGADESNRS